MITISGTSNDEGAAVSTVTLSISQDFSAGNNCYNRVANDFTAACPAWFAANGTVGDWSVANIAWVTGHRYYIVARSSDNANNLQDAFVVGTSSVAFGYDNAGPSVVISDPNDPAGADDRFSSLDPILGTAADAFPGTVARAQLRVQRVSNSFWWMPGTENFSGDDTQANQENAFFGVDPTPSWTSWQVSSAALTADLNALAGEQFRFIARAQDATGNWSATYSTRTVVYDVTPPVVVSTWPAQGATALVNRLTFVGGTMADQAAPGGNVGTVSRIQARLQRLSDRYYWNPGTPDWEQAEFTMDSNVGNRISFNIAGGTWSLTTALPLAHQKLINGASYYLNVLGFDDADDSPNQSAWNVQRSTFVFDSSAPVTTVNLPVYLSTRSALAQITGTVEDEPTRSNPNKVSAGISGVEFYIQRMSDSKYYQGSGNSWGNQVWLTTTAAGSNWTYAGALPSWDHNTRYWVVARSSDLAINIEDAFTLGVASVTVLFDTVAPTVAVSNLISTQAGGPYYINPTITALSGTAEDSPTDTALVKIAISSSPSGAGASWYNGVGFTAAFDYADNTVNRGTTTWGEGATDTWTHNLPTLTQGTQYTLRVRATDYAMTPNISTTTYVFTYDAIKPTATIVSPTNNYSTNTLITISGTSNDLGAGVSTVTVSIDKGGSGDGQSNCYNRAADAFTAVCPAWFAADGTVGDWNVSGVSFDSGYRYYIVARSSDNANNLQDAFELGVSSLAFSYEVDPPVSFVSNVSSGSYYRSLTQILGTVSDQNQLSNISYVQLQIRNFGANQSEEASDTFWDGESFTVSTYNFVNFVGGSSGTWAYTQVPFPWDNQRKYRLSVRARDVAENMEANEAGPIFTIDRSSPVAAITVPSGGAGYRFFPTVSGTASDGLNGYDAGIITSTNVEVAIQRLDDGRCWNNLSWTPAPCHPLWKSAAFSGSSSGTWTYATVPDVNNAPTGTRFLVLARAKDNTFPVPGNTQDVFSIGTSSNSFSIDNASGTVSIAFPVTSSQRSGLVITSGTLTDDFSGVYASSVQITHTVAADTFYWNGNKWLQNISTSVVKLANSTGALSSNWQYTALPSTWGVSGQQFTVQAWALDVAGNQSNDPVTVAWVFDVLNATGAVTTPSTDGEFRSPAIPLAAVIGTAEDAPDHAFVKISTVYVRYQREIEDTCWNGVDNWVACTDPSVWMATGGWKTRQLTWSLPKPTPDWPAHRKVDVHVRVEDQAAPTTNLSAWTTRFFIFDSTIPTVGIIDPNTAYEDAASFLGNITGTSEDTTDARRSKIAAVEVAIRNPATGPDGWWNGVAAFNVSDGNCTDAQTGGCWVVATTGTETGPSKTVNWTFTSTPSWVSGESYRVKVRAKDAAGNYSAVTTRNFIYDVSGVPSVAIIKPVSNDAFTTGVLVAISGTASDSFEIKTASVAIREAAGPGGNNNKPCWNVNDSTFNIVSVADECPESAWYTTDSLTNGPPIYDWAKAIVALQDDYVYEVKARAVDQEGKANSTAYISFIYDISKPTSSVRAPVNGSFLKTLTQITGTASDLNANASDIGGVQFALKGPDNKWWTAANDWTGTAHGASPDEIDWLTTTWTGAVWERTANLPAVGQMQAGVYGVFSRAYDVARNTQTTLASTSQFTWDATGPEVALTTPSQSASRVYSTMTVIGGTAQDSSGNNVAEVQYRVICPDGNSWTGTNCSGGASIIWFDSKDSIIGSGLLEWSTTYIPVITESNNNPWTTYARARDNAGNYSSVYATATFRFDATAPVSVTTNVVNGSTISVYAIIAGTGTDANSLDVVAGDVLQLRLYDVDANACFDGLGGWSGGCPGGGFIIVPNDDVKGKLIVYSTSYTWWYRHPTFGDGAWSSGHRYQINIIGRDPAIPANYEHLFSTKAFAFDDNDPVSAVANPGPSGSSWDGTRDFHNLKDTGGAELDPFTVSGTAVDVTAGINTHDAGDGDPWGVRVNICESSSTVDGCSKYFEAATSSFTTSTEPTPPNVAANASWVFNVGSPQAKFKNGFYYRVKVIAQDAVGNIEDQATKAVREFLVDRTYPTVQIDNPNQSEELDNISIRLTVADPEPLADPSVGQTNASGIVQPTAVQVSVRRDEGTTGSSPGAEDYWWCVDNVTYCPSVSTWTKHSDSGQVWYTLVEPTATLISGSTWDDSNLKCDSDAERLSGMCWQRGKTHWVQAKVSDRAGNQTVLSSPQEVLIAAPADHFLITLANPPPYTAGTEHLLNVTAHDSLHATAAGYNGRVRFQMLDTDPPESPGDGLPSDTDLSAGIATNISGLRLRRIGTLPTATGGARTINVYHLTNPDPADTFINSNDDHPLTITVTTATPNRLLILSESDQTVAQGCTNQNGNCSTSDGAGRTGSIAAKTAGATFQVRVVVTDQYFNKIGVASAPVFSLTTDDNYDNTESLYDHVTLTNGEQAYNITLQSKGNRVVTATGAGDETGIWNETAAINVKAKTSSTPKKLLVLLPSESSDPGSTTGKSGNPITTTVAGSTFTVTVYVTDEYFNPFDPGDVISESPAQVYLQTSDPYDLTSATKTLTDKTTTFNIVMYQASTQTVFAITNVAGYTNYTEALAPGATNIRINPDTAVKLQLIMPGEAPRPGYSGGTGVGYSVDRTTGGKVNLPNVLVAGDTYYTTVNCVDKYFNLVNSCNPTVDIEFADEANTSENDQTGIFANSALVAGTKQFPVRFLKAAWTGGADIYGGNRRVDITAAGKNADYNDIINVKPAATSKMQVVIRPDIDETERPGLLAGKSGGVVDKTAGTGFIVRINRTDQFWNRKAYGGVQGEPAETDNGNVMIVTSDPHDTESDINGSWDSIALGAVTNGMLDITVTPKQSTTTLRIDAYDLGLLAATGTVSGMIVNAAGATKVHIVLDCGAACGEKLEQGGTSGVNGVPKLQTAGSRIAVKVYLVDNNFNQVLQTTSAVKILTSGVTDFGVESSTKEINTGLASWSASDGPIIFNARAGAKLKTQFSDPSSYTSDNASSEFNISPSSASGPPRLIVRFDEQTYKPGQPDDTSNPLNPTFNCSLNSFARCGKDVTTGVTDKTAGVPFDVEVIATDFYYNRVSTNSTVRLDPSSQDGETGTQKTQVLELATGATVYNMVLRAAGNPRSLTPVDLDGAITGYQSRGFALNAEANPSKLVLLMPGEALSAGSLTGKSGQPDEDDNNGDGIDSFVTGKVYRMKVKLTDSYYNLVSAPSDLGLRLTSTDPNDSPDPLAASGDATVKIVGGQDTYDMSIAGDQWVFKTASATAPNGGWSVRVDRESGACASCVGMRSSTFTVAADVDPGNTHYLQVLMPGESNSPGSATGKSGSPSDQTIGVSTQGCVVTT
ncbi:MAG: hypothetical protein AABZ44_04220, partial [Elusimicrobiota bacterium]